MAIALRLAFYGIVTPLAIVSRLLGRPFIQSRPRPSAQSYWIPRKPIADPARMLLRQD